ncbi:hydantoinase B/oxoprolinase family protein [Marinicaulis aureus]|uniref:Hydantoinase B/oxoprolinase family protein n=1 Tax=Hyphococcus aureus TaxID=2666033 RepID=A0ABW1L3C3_9PROT
MSSAAEKLSAEFDPITIEIIQSSLSAITDEMFATMRRTAMSSIIYEVLDFGVALFNERGELASSGSGIPGFIGMLEPGVAAITKKFDADDIRDGDIFMLNIPHHGGVSHINDVVMILPVFSHGALIGWLANKAHWVDLGGAFPGGISPDATEIYQEGLQLPGIKVIDRGEVNQAVLDIILINSRVPETTKGDFWAGVASMRAGQKRFLSLAEKYGDDAVRYAMTDYLALGEKIARAAMADLPKGAFTAEETLEDGRVIKAAITITDDTFSVDLRGNPAQTKTSLNSSRDATFVDCQMIFKAITSPETFGNAGSFRPIELLTDEGSIFDAKYPAAMSIYYETSMLLFDLLWKALAQAMPNRLTAGHYASICGTFMGGPHPETGHVHGIVEPQLGGWGASKEHDGVNALYTGYHGDTFNVPVEVTEQRNGLMVDRLALNEASGGEGERIGGKGILLDYRILAEDWWLTMAYTRSETGPWGLEGGLQGSTNYVEVVKANSEPVRYSACTAIPLGVNDVVKVYTATGGGYGDPKKRSREKVLEDIKNGYVSKERAKEIYGVDG